MFLARKSLFALMGLFYMKNAIKAEAATIDGYQAVATQDQVDGWVYDWDNQIWIPNEEQRVGYQGYQRNILHDVQSLFSRVKQGFASRQGGVGGLLGSQGSSLVGIGLGAAAAGAAVVQSQQLNDLDDAKNKLQSDLATANTQLTTVQGQISTLQTRTNACSALDCAGPLSDGCTNGACTCGANPACILGGSNICSGGTCKCGVLPACQNAASNCVKITDGSAALPGVDQPNIVACGCAVDTDCTGSSNRCNGGFCACGLGNRECDGVTPLANNPGGPDPRLGLNCVFNNRGTVGANTAGGFQATSALQDNTVVCGCLNDNECAGSSNHCFNGVCRCGAGAACGGATPVCSNAQNVNQPGDNTAGSTCKCRSDDQCFPSGNRCVNGVCQCAAGAVCTNPIAAAGALIAPSCLNPVALGAVLGFATAPFVSGSGTSLCQQCQVQALTGVGVIPQVNTCGGVYGNLALKAPFCGNGLTAVNNMGTQLPIGQCGQCQLLLAGGNVADSQCQFGGVAHQDCGNLLTSCGPNTIPGTSTFVCCASGECVADRTTCST